MANDRPIYPKNLGLCTVKKVSNQVVGREIGSANPLQLIESSGSDGGILHSVWLVPLGANVASVFRLFIGLAGSTYLIWEKSLPAINSVSEAEQASPIQLELPTFGHIPNTSGFMIPPNASISCGLGTAVTGGYNVVLSGGCY